MKNQIENKPYKLSREKKIQIKKALQQKKYQNEIDLKKQFVDDISLEEMLNLKVDFSLYEIRYFCEDPVIKIKLIGYNYLLNLSKNENDIERIFKNQMFHFILQGFQTKDNLELNLISIEIIENICENHSQGRRIIMEAELIPIIIEKMQFENQSLKNHCLNILHKLPLETEKLTTEVVNGNYLNILSRSVDHLPSALDLLQNISLFYDFTNDLMNLLSYITVLKLLFIDYFEDKSLMLLTIKCIYNVIKNENEIIIALFNNSRILSMVKWLEGNQ